MLHGELVGTNSPQARNLFIKGCSPSRASLLRGYCFRLGNRVGSRRTMMTGSAWWARLGILWSHTWGLILSSHSFWSLSIEGVMGSSVVTRSCRALGAEKLPITRVVPSLVSISLPNKGVGHSGTTRNWWENICPSQQQRSAWVNIFVIVFSCGTHNGTVLGGEGSGVGGQDRVCSPGCQPRNFQSCLPHSVPPLSLTPRWSSMTGGLAGVGCFHPLEPS